MKFLSKINLALIIGILLLTLILLILFIVLLVALKNNGFYVIGGQIMNILYLQTFQFLSDCSQYTYNDYKFKYYLSYLKLINILIIISIIFVILDLLCVFYILNKFIKRSLESSNLQTSTPDLPDKIILTTSQFVNSLYLLFGIVILLHRIEFSKIDSYCSKILNIDPTYTSHLTGFVILSIFILICSLLKYFSLFVLKHRQCNLDRSQEVEQMENQNSGNKKVNLENFIGDFAHLKERNKMNQVQTHYSITSKEEVQKARKHASSYELKHRCFPKTRSTHQKLVSFKKNITNAIIFKEEYYDSNDPNNKILTLDDVVKMNNKNKHEWSFSFSKNCRKDAKELNFINLKHQFENEWNDSNTKKYEILQLSFEKNSLLFKNTKESNQNKESSKALLNIAQLACI